MLVCACCGSEYIRMAGGSGYVSCYICGQEDYAVEKTYWEPLTTEPESPMLIIETNERS